MRRRKPQGEIAESMSVPGAPLRDDTSATRKRLAPWDRIKFLLLLLLVWWVLVWSPMGNPDMSFRDALLTEVRSGAWVFVLMGLEAIRQIHYLISEHWAGYHRFWTVKFFGGFERVTHRRLSPWTRFRLWRLFVLLVWLVILAVVLSKFLKTSPVLALFQAPALLWH